MDCLSNLLETNSYVCNNPQVPTMVPAGVDEEYPYKE